LFPDYVILTDSWNMKPRLAEAIRGFPYILRFQKMPDPARRFSGILVCMD
jgi:hypothetical protein